MRERVELIEFESHAQGRRLVHDLDGDRLHVERDLGSQDHDWTGRILAVPEAIRPVVIVEPEHTRYR